MIYCKSLDKNFESKADMFAELKDRKEEVKAIKKATIKMTDSIPMAHISKKDSANKALSPSQEIKAGDYVYPVINTTKYIDSHEDLHLDGIWNKSAKEQTGKTYLLINHELAVGKVISQPKDVEIMVKDLSWSELGRKDMEGSTEALIFKSKLTEKSNRDGFSAYKDNDPVEHSIRMQYVKMELAINSDEEGYEAEKAEFDKHYPIVANKDRADELGYFWAVYEAKIHKEGSMVLAGSNDATPTLYDIEPSTKGTQTNEAAKALQQRNFYTNLI